MKIAAKTAQDPESTKKQKECGHKFAQAMIDLQAALLYAEGGIARWENERVSIY